MTADTDNPSGDPAGGDPPGVRGARPWLKLPPEAHAVVQPLHENVSNEIVQTIGREIPAYTRPFEGEFGDAVRTGVDQALRQFAEMIRTGNSVPEDGRRLYMALGRGELRAGRSIGALLAAYRIGAQVAWRHLGEAGVRAGLAPETLNLLAESVFAYIDELSADSAEGYALEQAARAGELDLHRVELIELLLRESPPADPRAIAAAADAADWRPPERVAAVVWRETLGRSPAARLPQGSIAAQIDGDFCALVPDPAGPGRRAELGNALRSRSCAIGPDVPLAQAARSHHYAFGALELAEAHGKPGAVFADEHRVELLVRADPLLVAEIIRELDQRLAGETAHSQERLRETLLAWLRHDGSVPAAAAELHVHAQTVRYRMTRLRELLGKWLDEPDRRFELEFALRAAV